VGEAFKELGHGKLGLLDFSELKKQLKIRI